MDDEEIASAREPSQHATLASVESAVEMGMDRIDVLLALFVAKCNEDLAMEYLVGGIPEGASTEVNLGGDASVTPDEENTDEDGDEGFPMRRVSSWLFRERKAKDSARKKLQTSCKYSDKTRWPLLTSNSLVLLQLVPQVQPDGFLLMQYKSHLVQRSLRSSCQRVARR